MRRPVPRNNHGAVPIDTSSLLAVGLASLESVKSAHCAVGLRMPQTQAITHKSVLEHPHAPLADLYRFMLENHTVDDSCAPHVLTLTQLSLTLDFR